jgi:hypothetical protein
MLPPHDVRFSCFRENVNFVCVLGHPLDPLFWLSQFHGHGSLLVCEVALAWSTWVRPALASASRPARWPPTVGRWGPHSNLCWRLICQAGTKSLVAPPPPPSFIYIIPVLWDREKRKKKFEFCSKKTCKELPSGGRQIYSLRIETEGLLRHPCQRSGWWVLMCAALLRPTTGVGVFMLVSYLRCYCSCDGSVCFCWQNKANFLQCHPMYKI